MYKNVGASQFAFKEHTRSDRQIERVPQTAGGVVFCPLIGSLVCGDRIGTSRGCSDQVG